MWLRTDIGPRRRLARWLAIRDGTRNRRGDRVDTRKTPGESTGGAAAPGVSNDDIREGGLDPGEDSIQLFMSGHRLMNRLLHDIDTATSRVCVETFILVDDSVGRSVRDALGRAVERGVEVFVMYDWMLSSRSLNETGWFDQRILAFPFRRLAPRPSALRPTNALRDHRKIVVIDSEIAYVGGYNFGEQFLAWRDSHIRIAGPSVGDVLNVFADFWNAHRPQSMVPMENVWGRSWDANVLVHRNDPTLAIFPIRGMLMEAIDRAERNVWITNAYFVPDRALRGTLADAARRGVDVRVLLPQQSNHPLTDVLPRGMMGDLLAAGVRVFLYRDFMVHAKTATIDGIWSTIGTANLDRWSMLGNYEINVEVRAPRSLSKWNRCSSWTCRVVMS